MLIFINVVFRSFREFILCKMGGGVFLWLVEYRKSNFVVNELGKMWLGKGLISRKKVNLESE